MTEGITSLAARTRSSRRVVLLAAALAIACLSPRATPAQTGGSREYQIKAAFLFNFGQFVTWPTEDLPAEDAPFVIGVLGEDPFGEALDEIIEGGTIQGRRASVERYRSVEEVGDCQILFVSSSESARLDRVFQALDGRGILTVGETEGFAEQYGVIRFFVVDNRLRLEINTAAAQVAGLTISSRLLSLAARVRTERG